MANPSELLDNNSATLRATPVVQTVTLNGDRSYMCMHDGEDSNSSASTGKIYLCTSGNLTRTDAEEVGKMKLIYNIGRVVGVGPGITSLQYATSGINSATFLIQPSPRYYGMF